MKTIMTTVPMTTYNHSDCTYDNNNNNNENENKEEEVVVVVVEEVPVEELEEENQ
jgi:hypothetical protein